jgi:hypothetical protein
MKTAPETNERDFLDGIFEDVIHLEGEDLLKRYVKTFRSFRGKDRLEDYYHLAVRFTEIGVLHGYALLNDKGIHWLEVGLMPQHFIDFYSRRFNIQNPLALKKIEEENVYIHKGKKRVFPPHFKPTDWSKITIRFITDREVYISVEDESKQANYESLGFSNDKEGKPNLAWVFLFNLAKNNGETSPLQKPIPDNIKQQKKQVSERLKTIFKNDTDPFYDPKEVGQIYRAKIKLIPPQEDNENSDTRDFFNELTKPDLVG